MTERDEGLRAVGDVLVRMAGLMSREKPFCLVCGDRVERLFLVGVGVYSDPCGHRQYQADRLPDAWLEDV